MRKRLPPGLIVLWSAVPLLGCEAAPEPAPLGHTVIPLPRSVETIPSDTFRFTDDTRILFDLGDDEGERVAHLLADLIGNSEATRPGVEPVEGPAPDGAVHLTRADAPAAMGPEDYALTVSGSGITIRASGPAGLFYGTQTLRHLLPPVVEYTAAYPQPLWVPAVRIDDGPRFGWRGAMLDVSRHFLPSRDVKRFIDLMVLYKLNRLHVHLSDDQGWRIEIPGWPELTSRGGSTEVGGGPGGFYTREEYADLVRYAQDRFVTVVPEIDVPGHTNAALASYPELNCDGVAPDLYIGTEVGFSSLCPDRDITYAFLDDVIREISELTPGPYFHIGGDEVRTLTEHQYVQFIERVQDIVRAHGKRVVGWDEIASADLMPESTVQLWRPLWPGEGQPPLDSAGVAAAEALEAGVNRAIENGGTFILSPADRIYLDMKYDTTAILGLNWAGYSDERSAYDWEVTEVFRSIPEGAIAGVEAPLWSETLGTIEDFEYMAFPRLAGVAELGWTPASAREWDEFRRRLGAQSARWTALGVNFRRSPGVPWDEGPILR